MVNIEYGGWIRVARTFASNRGLRLVWASESQIETVGAEAWTDGKALYVRKPDARWTDEQFNLWLYTLVHEFGHNTPKRRLIFDVLKNKKPSGMLAYVLNVLEDHVQERELYDDEPELRKTLTRGRAAFYTFSIRKANDAGKAANQAAKTLFAWDADARADEFTPDLRGYGVEILGDDANDERVKLWQERLKTGGYADELARKPDCYGVFDVAERILREVFETDPEQHQAGGQGSETQAGEGKQDNNSGQGQSGDAAGSPDAGGDGQKADGEGSGKPGGVGDEPGALSKAEAEADYSDLLAHAHGADKRSGSGSGVGGGIRIDYESYFSEGATQFRQFTPEFDSIEVYDCEAGNLPRHDNTADNPEVPPSALSRTIGRYMQANSRNKRLHGQKKGKLSGKNLYKLRIPNLSQDARERVFYNKVVNSSKDVAVYIGVDCSGSMAWEGRSAAACAAVTHLHEVLSGLGIKFEVAGFSIENGHGVHVVFQSFGKKRKTEDVEADVRRVIPFEGANRDGEFIMWARERLLRQKASRHIMIILSDGQPIHRAAGDVAGYTKEVIEQIERDGRIELHAIGICSHEVAHFYSSYDVLSNSSELEEKLLNVLKNKIIVHI